ncbi:hypothetical protein L2E82_30075 [Cichorium intybus]|uniref:Uncharacterized protein n=1 Tax=Cichorium intybus TaxID=13427 RepID=A0ACB9CZD1_CICIN|nr:hypothetical protein L2E82_30075 [Cichorium intybus]
MELERSFGDTIIKDSFQNTINQEGVYEKVEDVRGLQFETCHDKNDQEGVEETNSKHQENLFAYSASEGLSQKTKPDSVHKVGFSDDATQVGFSGDATQVGFSDDATQVGFSDEATQVGFSGEEETHCNLDDDEDSVVVQNSILEVGTNAFNGGDVEEREDNNMGVEVLEAQVSWLVVGRFGLMVGGFVGGIVWCFGVVLLCSL